MVMQQDDERFAEDASDVVYDSFEVFARQWKMDDLGSEKAAAREALDIPHFDWTASDDTLRHSLWTQSSGNPSF